jgi:hypothetical protein
LSIAVLLFSQHFLKSLFPVNLQIAESTQLPWLQGWDAVVLGAFLLIIAFLLYVAARQRALSNDRMRPSAGCPSCQKSKLIRVSRHSSDRLLALSYIPLGRFVCPNCRWEGRRVIRNGNGSKERSKQSESTGLPNAIPASRMNSIFAPAAEAQKIKVEEGAKQDAAPGEASVETPDQVAVPSPAEGSEMGDPFPSGEGFRLTDKWSNHAITVHAQAGSDCEDLGEVVGTLHVQIWQRPGAETELQACLDHITTTVTIYKRAQEADRSQR